MIGYRVITTAHEDLRRIEANCANRQGLNLACAQRVRDELRDWFNKRRSEPNARGWPSSGLWGQIARSTRVAGATNDSGLVSISHPSIKAKVEGADIEPLRGRFLSIAAMAAAYAAGSPREGATAALKFAYMPVPEAGRWPGDRALPGTLVPALVAEEAGTKQVKDRRKGREGELRTIEDKRKPEGIWYWLIRRAHIPADERALPPSETLQSAISDEVDSYMRYLQKRSAA